MLQKTDREFRVTVVAKSTCRGLEYWVVLLNDEYDENVKLLDSVGKFSIFHSPSIESTVEEAKVWSKFLGVELDLSSVESARSTQAAKSEEEPKQKPIANLSVTSFGSLRKRSHKK